MIHITHKEQCCGCSACYNICPVHCIEMKEDSEGFLYPYVQKSLCIECGLCQDVCMFFYPREKKKTEQKAYLVQNEDPKILQESTSGGAFTAIAENVISRHGIVFGAAYDEDFNVCHTWVDCKEELSKFRNSKYVQSNLRNSFQEAKKFLQDGKIVCYSGTPCQIEGFRNFLGKQYENLILVDVVCRAAPSPLIWRKYKKFLFRKLQDNVLQINFRNKSLYGYEYSQMAFIGEHKTVYNGIESDPYLRAFFSNLSDRPSCYHCPVKTRYRVSDLTIWDCLDVYKFSKKFDDNRGVTRVLTHTAKGSEIIEQLKGCKKLELDSDAAVEGVKELVQSVSYNEKRKEFFMDAVHMEDKEFFDKYFPVTFRVKLEQLIRKYGCKLGIYGILKRAAKKIFRV